MISINSPYNAQLSIYDINGRLVISKLINNGANNVQLNKTGVYLVKIEGNKGSVNKKVVVGL